MDKRTYLAWLQSTQAPQQNEGLKKTIDMVQTAGDVASFGLSFVPGGNLVGSAIDMVSAGVDLAQGDYVDSAFRGGAAAAGLIPGGGAVVKTAQAVKAAKAAKAAKAVETGASVSKGAVQATRTGTQGAQAVAKGSETVAAAAKPSLLGRATEAMKTGARTITKTATKAGQEAIDNAPKNQKNANISNQYQPYQNDKNQGLITPDQDFLAPVGADVQSNLVSQGTQATHSRKRDNSMDPAFSYRGAYGMFRPVGYGMNENTLNKMVNNHVNKFLKSKKGKELKSEVKDIAKKRVD